MTLIPSDDTTLVAYICSTTDQRDTALSMFFSDRAQWNLASCYAAQYPSKMTELDNLLMAILSDKNHAYFNDAEVIKSKL